VQLGAEENEVSLGELDATLALDESVTSRRLRQATEFGYLVTRRPAEVGRRGSSLGDPMPEILRCFRSPAD
jgi:hypothetical protein